ncbi:MAG TPA: site-specific integrase [Actinomycetes bacterium]|jgi:hypothetical protein|nr:site-specific integrase [Actinomycetes bacterium]
MGLAKPLTVAAQKATSVTTTAPSRPEAALTLGAAIDSWFVHLSAGDVSPKTLDAYRWGVGRFAQHLAAGTLLADITVNDVESFIGSLKTSGLSEASRNAAYRPVRTFLRWCVKRHHHVQPLKPEAVCHRGVVVTLRRDYWVHQADHSPQPDGLGRCFVCGLATRPFMGRVAHDFGHPGQP